MTSDSFLRFAPHLGYISQDQPLFRESVGNVDPTAHIVFAAQHDFPAMFDPWIGSRPASEIERMIDALRQFGMASGCIAYAPLPAMLSPLFARPGRSAWQEIAPHLDRAIDLAGRIGAKNLAILLQGTSAMPWRAQQEAAADHLRAAGDRASAAGLALGIEHMIALPDMMLRTTEDAVDFLERTNHSAVQLIFDTGHVADMDGDIHAAWITARDHVCVLQLADMPGRVAPGSGTLDFVRFLAQAARDGKAGGVIELEHGWSETSVAAEQSGIELLHQIDSAVRAAVESGATM